MPVFLSDGDAVGYTAIKAPLARHRRARRSTAPTPTDVFQEGTIFPGVKLYSAGRARRRTSSRMAIANSRLPKFVAGDINAEVVGVRAGAAALVRARRALRARHASGAASSGCTTTARPSSAATSSRSPTGATSVAARWTTTGSPTTRSRSRSCSRSTGRRRGSTSAAHPTRGRARSTARSRPPCRPRA